MATNTVPSTRGALWLPQSQCGKHSTCVEQCGGKRTATTCTAAFLVLLAHPRCILLTVGAFVLAAWVVPSWCIAKGAWLVLCKVPNVVCCFDCSICHHHHDHHVCRREDLVCTHYRLIICLSYRIADFQQINKRNQEGCW